MQLPGPLSVQSQFLLLPASLQARMAHLMRTVPRDALAPHMHRKDAAVWQAAEALLDLPQGVGEYGAGMEGPYKACCTLGRVMMGHVYGAVLVAVLAVH